MEEKNCKKKCFTIYGNKSKAFVWPAWIAKIITKMNEGGWEFLSYKKKNFLEMQAPKQEYSYFRIYFRDSLNF